MRILSALILCICLAPRSAHAGRESWEVLDAVATNAGSPATESFSVNLSTASGVAAGIGINSAPIVSTGTANGTASIAIPVKAPAIASCFTNESSTVAMRVGPAGITATVGWYIPAGATRCLDTNEYKWRAALYVITVDGSSQQYSTFVEVP